MRAHGPPSSARVRAWAFPGRDPAGPQASIEWLLVERSLQLLDVALPRAALLVKGAALALTMYESPLQRPMCDVDVLVPRSELRLVAAELGERGFRRVPSQRWLTQVDLDIPMLAPTGVAPVTVELHGGLDKLVERRIDYGAIAARSQPAPGFERLRLPSAEDHLVLVALHLALADFAHPAGFADLALLIERGVDVSLAHARAKAWAVETAFNSALAMLGEIDPSLVSADGARVWDRTLRFKAIARTFARRRSAAPEHRTLGLPWVLRQTLLRDDLGRWLTGLGIYGAKRAVERASRPFILR